MSGNLLTLAIPPAYDGYDSDSAPDVIPSTKAPWVENFLVDRPGVLPMRGPLNETSAFVTGLSGGQKPVGIWAFNDNIFLGLRSIAGGQRDPWTAPYRKAATAADLAAGVTTAYHVNLTNGTVTPVGVTADQVPGHRWTRVGTSVYGVSFDAVAAAVSENGGFLKLRPILRWDGTAVAPTAYASTVAPAGAQDVRGHANRLFALGGRDPSGTNAIEQNTLYFSDPVSGSTALPATLAAWQDDVSGLVNKIVVDADDQADFGVGLGKVGQNLAIFKRHSIHVLYGYGPSTFTVRNFTYETGCLDARSIVEYQNGCYFMSDQGLMWFDGSQLQNVSPTLRSSLLASSLAAVGDSGVDGGRVTCSKLPGGYIGVSVGVSPASVTGSTTTFSGWLHAQRSAWTLFSSNVISGTKPTFYARSATKTVLLDDERIFVANKITVPELESAALRGLDTDSFAGNWRIDNATAFTGAGNTLRNGSGIDAFPLAAASNYPIPAKWYSALTKLAPMYRRYLLASVMKSQLHRVLLDYNFQLASGADDAASGTGGWTVTLVGGDSTALKAPYTVARQGTPTNFAFRRRNTTDTFAEASDIQVRVEWLGAATPLARAEILGAIVEYEVSRQRSST